MDTGAIASRTTYVTGNAARLAAEKAKLMLFDVAAPMLGVKANQLENDYRAVTGKFSGEFSKAQFYDVFKAGTTTPIQITWTLGDAGGGNPFSLDTVLPACKLNSGTNNVGGPDIIMGDIEFVALDDQATTPIQLTYVSTDTSL